MNLIAIDTTTASGGVALSQDGEIIGIAMIKAPLRYSEKIVDLIDFLLEAHRLTLSQIDFFAVATGPGSFTGLRIGLATVKAFCQSFQRSIVPVSTLEALAYRFRWVSSCVGPMIDARRNQIFGAIYEISEGESEAESHDCVMHPARWLKSLPLKEYTFVGDGARYYKELVLKYQPHAQVLATDNRVLEPLCEIGHARAIAGSTVSAFDLKANYVRPSDAELAQHSRKEESSS